VPDLFFGFDHARSVDYDLPMSVREQLQREASLLPEDVVQRLLDYLHSIHVGDASPVTPNPPGDFFDTYWSRWYGRCEGQAWDEPAELPMETREAW